MNLGAPKRRAWYDFTARKALTRKAHFDMWQLWGILNHSPNSRSRLRKDNNEKPANIKTKLCGGFNALGGAVIIGNVK